MLKEYAIYATVNVTEKIKIWFTVGRKHYGEKGKTLNDCILEVAKSRYCIAKSNCYKNYSTIISL